MTKQDDLHFGYSLRFSPDGKDLTISIRFDEHCTNRILIDALTGLAEQFLKEAESQTLDRGMDS